MYEGVKRNSKKAVFDVQVRDNIYYNLQYVCTGKKRRLVWPYYESGMTEFDPLLQHCIDQMYQRIYLDVPTNLFLHLLKYNSSIYSAIKVKFIASQGRYTNT